MNIQIKRAYEPPEASDGFRILVDRMWPRGLSKEHLRLDMWLRDIAPSSPLRKWFGHDPAKWDQFKANYLEELANNPGSIELFLQAAKGQAKVTLVYGAKDPLHNQAVILQEFLQQHRKP